MRFLDFPCLFLIPPFFGNARGQRLVQQLIFEHTIGAQPHNFPCLEVLLQLR